MVKITMEIKETANIQEINENSASKSVMEKSQKANKDIRARGIENEILVCADDSKTEEQSIANELGEVREADRMKLLDKKVKDNPGIVKDPREEVGNENLSKEEEEEEEEDGNEKEKEQKESTGIGSTQEPDEKESPEEKGSMKRLAFLLFRKNSEVHDKLWKAHEQGISFVLRKRSNSLTQIEDAKTRMKRNELDSRELSYPPKKNSFGHARALSNNDIFRQQRQQQEQQQQQEDEESNKPQNYKKNVSFCNTVKRPSLLLRVNENIDEPAPLNEATPRSQDSTSTFDLKSDASNSIPSIHHATPLRHSESILSSISLLTDLGINLEDGEGLGLLLCSPSSHSGAQQDSSHHSSNWSSFFADHRQKNNKNSSGQQYAFLRKASSNVYKGQGIEVTESKETREDDPHQADTSSHQGDQTFIKTFENMPKPVLLRDASANVYDGQGIEACEARQEEEEDEETVPDDTLLTNARQYKSLVSNATATATNSNARISCSSTSSLRLLGSSRCDLDLLLSKTRSISITDSEASLYGNLSTNLSWDAVEAPQHYDAWAVLKDEYATEYYGGGETTGENNNDTATMSFCILGTNADDESAKPHVLSPPLMESLKSFLPFQIAEDNFWLKFSMVRDGASLHTLLELVHDVRYAIIAIETVDGEVFGSFTSMPWREENKYFGIGDSFLWKMRQNRNTPCYSIVDQAHLESELDVYPWTGNNYYIQYCPHKMIALGGGDVSNDIHDDSDHDGDIRSGGFGIAIDEFLLMGSSSPCGTFDNPSLATFSDDGIFEVANLEVWALTPCLSEEEAEKLEFTHMFFENARKNEQ